jgi:tetratricopeptide (TPR) repeat protein
MKLACVVVLGVSLATVARADEPLDFDPDARPPRMATDAQIQALERLIATTPDASPEKPDFMFREAILFNDVMRFYTARAASQTDPFKRDDDLHKAEQWRLAAAKGFLDIADHPERYRSYPRMDEVLMRVATLLTAVHKEDAARKYFKRLLTEYPSSPLVPELFVVFGDYYFTQHDYDVALDFYDRVQQFYGSRVVEYARYKMAWTYLDMHDCVYAHAMFAKVANGNDIDLAYDARTQLAKLGNCGGLWLSAPP